MDFKTGSGGNYIKSIQAPSVLGGFWLSEFSNGPNSGWMYTVDGAYPSIGLKDYVLKDGEAVIWHYVNNYTLEIPYNGQPALYDQYWLDVPDIDPKAPAADDATAVSNAKEALQSTAFSAAMATVNTQSAVKAWLEDKISKINLDGVTVTLTMNSFTAAKAGTKTNPSGTNGSFTFTASLSKGEAADSVQLTGNIIAEAYNDDISVNFRLIGDTADKNGKAHFNSYVNWIKTASHTMDSGSTVYDLLDKVLDEHGMDYTSGASNTYIKSIQAPAVLGGFTLSEGSNGARSKWMFTVNEQYTAEGLSNLTLKDGDSVIVHYVNDYTLELPYEGKPAVYDNPWLEAPDTDPKAPDTPLPEKLQTAINKVIGYIGANDYMSEWVVIGHANSGQTIDKKYLSDMAKTVKDYFKNEVNTEDERVTEHEKRAIAILAAGGDPRSIGGYDLLERICNFKVDSPKRDISFQGLNGVIFALIALDSGEYCVPENVLYDRDWLISYLLDNRNADGGWDLSVSGNSDPDITAMALQALALYHSNEHALKAINEAVAWLSSVQNEDGCFSSMNTPNSESTSQVIIALCANDIDPTSAAFTKSTGNPVDALINYQRPDGAILHVKSGTGDTGMSTEQGYLALIAYKRYLIQNTDGSYRGGKTSIYYLAEDIAPPVITTDLENKTVNKADLTFSASAKDAIDGNVEVSVTLNGNTVKKSLGKYRVTLSEGSNTILLSTSDSKNNKSTLSFTVVYNPSVKLVTKIDLNKSKLKLEAGKSETLTAKITPSDADNKDIFWSTSNSAIAAVDSAGKVTAIAEGSAVITAKAADYGGAYDRCTVTVEKASEPEKPIEPEKPGAPSKGVDVTIGDVTYTVSEETKKVVDSINELLTDPAKALPKDFNTLSMDQINQILELHRMYSALSADEKLFVNNYTQFKEMLDKLGDVFHQDTASGIDVRDNKKLPWNVKINVTPMQVTDEQVAKIRETLGDEA